LVFGLWSLVFAFEFCLWSFNLFGSGYAGLGSRASLEHIGAAEKI